MHMKIAAPRFQKMNSKLEENVKNFNKKKKKLADQPGAGNDNDENLKKEEESLKKDQKELSELKQKATMQVSFINIASMMAMNKFFSGKIVAILPFQPMLFFKALAHRGIEGEDFTECSYMLIYILCNMSFKGIVQKFLGYGSSRAVEELAKPGQVFSVDLPEEKKEESDSENEEKKDK